MAKKSKAKAAEQLVFTAASVLTEIQPSQVSTPLHKQASKPGFTGTIATTLST
jgi:hypothetical protein